MSEVRCRPAGAEDFRFLATMLGESAVWRPDKPSPTANEVLADLNLAHYIEGWPRPGDSGVVAEDGGPVGAAWYRAFAADRPGYGFVSEAVPELAIAVAAGRRHEGIGRQLLVALIEASEAQAVPGLSLSVNIENPARQLYESLGFELVGPVRDTALTMIRQASAT